MATEPVAELLFKPSDAVPISTENIKLLCAWKSRIAGPPKRGGNTIGLRVPLIMAQVNKVQAAFMAL